VFLNKTDERSGAPQRLKGGPLPAFHHLR